MTSKRDRCDMMKGWDFLTRPFTSFVPLMLCCIVCICASCEICILCVYKYDDRNKHWNHRVRQTETDQFNPQLRHLLFSYSRFPIPFEFHCYANKSVANPIYYVSVYMSNTWAIDDKKCFTWHTRLKSFYALQLVCRHCIIVISCNL